jgi:hypothetical protein
LGFHEGFNLKISTFLLIGTLSVVLAIFGQNCSESDLKLPPQSQPAVADTTLKIEADFDASQRLSFGTRAGLRITSDNIGDGLIQWYHNDVPVIGGNSVDYFVEQATDLEEGTYYVKVGDKVSNSIMLTVERLRSCNEIRQRLVGTLEDGFRQIDPDGAGPIAEYSAHCDMTTDGGGFTRITINDARLIYGGVLNNIEGTNITFEFDAENRPYTRDGGVAHTVAYDFTLPFGYQNFYLKDYMLKANSPDQASDLNQSFNMTNWNNGHGGSGIGGGNPVGDVGFGSSAEVGPTTSYGLLFDELNLPAFESPDATYAWPGNNTVYSNAANGTNFRIGFGEDGTADEGWIPWFSGDIYVR